jgi:PleD family two-component response regulator/EAL domain-containing protein (putative c-di-GMP-specific phosphodiesterase class I)
MSQASDAIPSPSDQYGADILDALHARWHQLTSVWDVEIARAFSAELDDLIDARNDALAERAADLVAYLAAFADGSLIPNRGQLGRLNLLANALFSIDPSAILATVDNVVSLPVAATPAARPVEARNTVCLLGISDAFAPGLVDSLTERGFQVRLFDEIEPMEAWLETTRPSVLVMEALRLRALPRLASRLGEAAPGSPLGPALVVLSGSRDVAPRLLAMRAGATAYFGAPLDSYTVVARIEELLGRVEATPFRVLIVDADREHAAMCGRWLVEQGMTARLAFDGDSGLKALGEFRPDIVLIDYTLPDARGFELAQVMHQQTEFATVPIVLYADDADDAQRFDAIAAGADEVLVKPLKPRHLTSVIRSRVQRAMWFRGQTSHVAGRNPRTGLFLREHLVERIGDPRVPRGSALLLLAIDRAERVREVVGLSGLAHFEMEIAQALREALATGDQAAPLRDFVYAVLATRELRDQVTELAERLRLKFAEHRAGGGEDAVPITLSIGITLLEEKETSADARVARAEAASLAAARVGGNRVLWYEPNEYTLVRPDAELAVRAVLSRPWNDANVRAEFRPLVPLGGKLGGQFDFVFALVSTQDPGARADYSLYAPIAAELGTLHDIDRRRLAIALDVRESRLRLGRQIRLFLPVLAQTLLDEPLLAWLMDELKSRKLSGTGLTLELGSADLVDQRVQLAEPLRRLRQAGVRLGLSDFGRDWAAVHLLNTLPVDFLRLDPELVEHTTSDKAVSSTLLALVRKAHQLGAVVIAPSVESIERAHVLLRLGIDYGAGDGLGRTLPEPDFDFNRPIW